MLALMCACLLQTVSLALRPTTRDIPSRDVRLTSVSLGRRQWAWGASTLLIPALCKPVGAFENALPEAATYAKKPKTPGSQPKDLGLLMRETKGDDVPALKGCKTSPNCFSTTGDPELDVDSIIAPWIYPEALSVSEAALEIEAVVRFQ